MSDKLAAAEDSQWRNLETQTGRSRDQWLALAGAQGFAKHGELVAWLKKTHGIGHGYANLIAIRAREATQRWHAVGRRSGRRAIRGRKSGAEAAV